MAKHLDLEEQEQLDQLRHFWNTWGNLITWALIVVLGAYAAWNGWNYWQRRQGAQAAALYELERSADAGDVPHLERVLGDIKDRFGTAYAAQGAPAGGQGAR
jgi:predicted negative regulator of RcsB-dependent stress response